MAIDENGSHAGRPYLVMELVPATTLAGAMLVLALGALGALGGCDGVFGLTSLSPPGPDAAMPDAPQCVMPFVHDAFAAMPPCGSWGTATSDPTGAVVSVSGGQLVIQPGPGSISTNSHSGCRQSGTSSFASGLFLEVKAPPAGYERLVAYAIFTDATNTLTYVGLQWSATAIYLTHGSVLGHVDFDPLRTTWARLRPADDGTAIIAESSADGLAWQFFAQDATPAPTEVRIQLVAGVTVDTPVATPAPIVVDGMNVCPR